MKAIPPNKNTNVNTPETTLFLLTLEIAKKNVTNNVVSAPILLYIFKTLPP